MHDNINNPPHYNSGGIECIDYMKDNMEPTMFIGYLEGNCKKYLHRWRYKGVPVQDIEKALWYLTKLRDELKGEPELPLE